MDYKELKFGVELEFTGLTRSQAAKVMGDFFGATSLAIGGGYDAYIVEDSLERIFKICSDSSIHAQYKNRYGSIIEGSNDYRCELVTPPLTYEDIPQLQELVRTLRKKGMLVNESCGIHIHVEAVAFDGAHLRYLCNMVYAKQNLISNALSIKSRRSSYCLPLADSFITELNKKKPSTIEALADCWYGDVGSIDRERHYHNSRYHVLNLHPLLSHRQPTIELRCFNSTTHVGELKAYIQFSLLLVAAALNTKSASSKITIPTTGNEKYTVRVWLLKLGMIGDEFKTARLHLLKNLIGNTAWRDRV